MKLGNFSVSLNVKNIQKSKEFYQALGFNIFAGDIEQYWLIMKNEKCTIGLFQGMLEKNTLTFNPGWNENAKEIDTFTDIRDLQKQLKQKGIDIQNEVDEKTTGPANMIVIDPDGNPILFDQHVEKKQ